MEERTFIDGSRPVWERLASSVERARRHGVTELDVDTLRVMHDDYRRTAADLAYAQTHYASSKTTLYLNGLVGQAHGELYATRPGRAGAAWRFLARGYPAIVRRYWRPVAIAALLLFGAAALGYLLAFLDFGIARTFVPEAYRETVGQAAAGGGAAAEEMAAVAPAFAVYILTNNIQVSFTAFAGGATGGVLTAYALLYNGLVLGGLAGLWSRAGADLQFWSLIIPHGALELAAICLAGGSGLMMGRALLLPGDLPRAAALRRVAPDAVRLVLGTIPLFVIAGLIEGFLTPSPLDPVLKIVVGFFVLGVLVLYVLVPGRSEDAEGGPGRLPRSRPPHG